MRLNRQQSGRGDCPSDAELEQYALFLGYEEVDREIDGHLEKCVHCQARLAAFQEVMESGETAGESADLSTGESSKYYHIAAASEQTWVPIRSWSSPGGDMVLRLSRDSSGSYALRLITNDDKISAYAIHFSGNAHCLVQPGRDTVITDRFLEYLETDTVDLQPVFSVNTLEDEGKITLPVPGEINYRCRTSFRLLSALPTGWTSLVKGPEGTWSSVEEKVVYEIGSPRMIAVLEQKAESISLNRL